VLLASISALRYQPEVKLMTMGITNNNPMGMPMRNWRKTFRRRRRLVSQ
jgi:hypothetical protein